MGLGISYRITFLLTFAAVVAERLWNTFWPVISLVFVFAALALTGLLFAFGNDGHLAISGIFCAATLLLTFRRARAFHFPSASDIDRRIEQENGLTHRPLEAVRDRPVVGTKGDARILWEKHLLQLRDKIRNLSPVKPQSRVPTEDRFSLRHGAMLVLLIGLVVAGEKTPARLQQAFEPSPPAFAVAEKSLGLDAWIVPPEYTSKATVFLTRSEEGIKRGEQEPVTVPANSVIKIRLSGKGTPPRIFWQETRVGVEQAADKSFIADITANRSGILIIKQGLRTVGTWRIGVMQDRPPEITLEIISKTAQASTKIGFGAADDYGITRLTATLVPEGALAEKAKGQNLVIDMPPPTENGLFYHIEDFSSHIYAGMQVGIRLTAQDAAGNETITETQTTVLPERKFQSAAARALITERKRLFWFDNDLTRRITGDALAAIANEPQIYKGDIVVFLSLASAVRRLGYDGDAESVESVINLLWDVALKIEDGGLSLAARELREALQQLSERLKDKKTSDAEIRELADAAQEKMLAYMQALASELQQRMNEGKRMPEMPPEIAERLMQRIDMSEIMRQLEDIAKGGDREQMQKMAEFMQRALDNIDSQEMQAMQEQQQKAMEGLKELSEIIEQQQKLMDETGKKKPSEQCQGLAESQEALRGKLGNATRNIGEMMPDIPEQLSKADQAMKEAQQLLSANNPQEARKKQQEALDALQQGMDGAISEMASRMQQMILSFGAMPSGSGFGEGYDPLGREDGTQQQGGDVKLPDEAERRRVQEIIKELRGRSNEFDRPKVEREYIDRLLEMFY